MVSLSFVVTTHKRADDAIECIESVLSQDYQDLEVVVVTSPAGDTTATIEDHFHDSLVRVHEEPARRGPAAAGNVAFEHAEGDVIVSLDDDVVLVDADAASRIATAFDSNPNLGILAFKIVDYHSGEIHSNEIPVGPDGHQPDVAHPTTYFVGAGAALLAEAVAATEGYPESFYYHMQELDLSFQIMALGYQARYDPEIVVRHKRSSPGRPDSRERWRLVLENRTRVATRHLPVRYVISSLLVWTAYVLYRTRGSIMTVKSAYLNLLADADTLREERDVLDGDTLRRINRNGGRLWY